MGLFKKREKNFEERFKLPDLPQLPELPPIGSLENPSQIEIGKKEALPQLPSFPNTSFGDKFSQNSIKEAIAGKKEVENEGNADEFELPKLPEVPMMQEPLKTIRTKEMDESQNERRLSMEFREIKKPFSKNIYSPEKKEEPVFIRIDKFEESLKLLDITKKQLQEIEEMLGETKNIKEKEEQELLEWENQVKSIKQQVEKIDKDLFSKIE